MAIKYNPDFTILLRKGTGKTSQKVEFFRATKFSARHFEGNANLYRLRTNRKWYGKTFGPPNYFTYVSIEVAMDLVSRGIKEALK